MFSMNSQAASFLLQGWHPFRQSSRLGLESSCVKLDRPTRSAIGKSKPDDPFRQIRAANFGRSKISVDSLQNRLVPIWCGTMVANLSARFYQICSYL